MSRTDLDAATLANSLRARAGDGSIEWVSEQIQASVLLDIADMLDENAKLRKRLKASDDGCKRQADNLIDKYHKIAQLQTDNAKLRELCADMYGFIKRMDEDCGDVTFSDCFDYCKHDTADDGCCKTGECWYEQRMRELGIEVDDVQQRDV